MCRLHEQDIPGFLVVSDAWEYLNMAVGDTIAELNREDVVTALGALGIALNVVANGIPPGNPAPPEMTSMEALQDKLTRALHGGGD